MAAALAMQAQAQKTTREGDLLSAAQFRNPPEAAKPRVWWHWLSNNVSYDGITADLKWMKRVDIGGFQMFDGDMHAPLFVDKPVVWMTPEWKRDWRHAALLADQLHLEMAMAASGGWSETAGPWVKPSQGMKRYVWSETSIVGPTAFHSKLSTPPHGFGKFQDVPLPPAGKEEPDLTLPGAKPQPVLPSSAAPQPFYADAAVVAYRIPDDAAAELQPAITSSSGSIDGALLTDGSYRDTTPLTLKSKEREAWIELRYPQAVEVCSLTLGLAPVAVLGGDPLPQGEVQYSDDGRAWHSLIALPGPPEGVAAPLSVRTYSFPAVRAKAFRIVIPGGQTERTLRFSELRFSGVPEVKYWQDKAAFGLSVQAIGEATERDATPVGDVMDLTSRMRPDGTLDWDAPAGKWKVMRLGYAAIGEINHPATPAATGLEVDKLSRTDVNAYLATYTKMIQSVAGPYFGKSFRYFLMDSWEAGQENWTEAMPAEFRRLRGYDMTPYLPVLAGHIVGSAATSEAFLWDFRRTIADLLAENHYRAATAFFKQHGVGLYAEAMGVNLPTNGDGLLNKGQVTVPMGEFWTAGPGRPQDPWNTADIRETSSAAHIYGKPIAAAESFTSWWTILPWEQSPFYLKPLADEAFAAGINRIVIHTSDQQPFTDEAHQPGMTLGPFGQHYNRNMTWAEQSKAWNDYLARCSYMLQRGRYVADVAIFYGEGAPVTVPSGKTLSPAVPTHYGYDYVDADVLLHHAAMKNGRLHLDSGMSYAVLAIPDDERMLSLPLLKQLRAFVQQGLTLVGPQPVASPTLSDGPHASDEVKRIAAELWDRPLRRGHVYSDRNLEDVLASAKIKPDLRYDTPTHVTKDFDEPMPVGTATNDLVYIHRHLANSDIYFVATQKLHAFDVNVTFRMRGAVPLLWHPDTGETEAVDYTVAGGETTVPLHMDPAGSVFVVFTKDGPALGRHTAAATTEALTTLTGPWEVHFPPHRGAPDQSTFPSLASWTEQSAPGIRYFSGSATYTKQLEIHAADLKPHQRLLVDLGRVDVMAELTVNGKPYSNLLWKPPFLADITNILHVGSNTLEIKVTNLWANRLIGDQQPGTMTTYTFTDFHAFKPDAPLMPSGLLGPVRLLRQRKSEFSTIVR
ncbi:glycosyl hydrolase [Granulicella cerasi]|uniref:Glycosyl hydrolase n=1 Tax=Granulicella cerasi TaxID=741063 RepID=A0ABW1Z6P1_9BACT